MSYIFDSFPSKKNAEQYVKAVRKLGIKADIWDSAEICGLPKAKAEKGEQP